MADISSDKDQLPTKDVLSSSLTLANLTVGTTAVAIRVGGSNLTPRKVILIQPTNGTIYWGSTNTVTTSTGFPIFQNQQVSIAIDETITLYAVAATNITTIIAEGY